MNGKELCNMDAFLAELGLCRKAIAKDGSCIFRAVSEKLFLTQAYHERVREKYLDHMSKHVDEYQMFVDEDLNNRLEAVDKGEIQPGLIEMAILSRIYSLEFFVFHTPNQEPFNVTQNNFSQEVYLCFVGGCQYDLVYSKSVLQTAAVCQSVLYEILYRDVFRLDSELDEAVLFLELQKELPRNSNFRDCFLSDVIALFGTDKTDTLKKLCGRSSPPLPFRIAKALHPALFRNVELDIVQEEKREARLRNLGLSSGFSPGDKCHVVLDEQEDHPYNAHIQSIDEDGGTLLVFLEELGVKQTVPAKNVLPLPLDLPKLGEPSFLPVTNIDLLRFIKKGKRRRQHRVMPIAVVAGHVAASPPSDRSISSISTTSPNSSSASSTKENSYSSGSGSSKNSNSAVSSGRKTITNSNFHKNRPRERDSSESEILNYSLDNSSVHLHPNNVSNINSSSSYDSCIGTSSNNNNINVSNKNSSQGQGDLVSGHAPIALNLVSDYTGQVTGGYSPTLGSEAVSYTEYHEYTVDKECGSVEACPVALTFTPTCLRSVPAPGGSCTYPHSHAHHTLMSGGSSSGVAVGGHPPPPPPPLQPPPHVQPQGGYWMPLMAVPYHQHASGNVNFSWPPSHESYGKDLSHPDVNTLRFFFNLGVEYYRMSSSGQPSSCYPPGVVFTPTPSHPADMPQHASAATGTAVMVDASGHHHYANVLYTPQELGMDASGLPVSAVCVGEGLSSSSSNSFVAPLSLSDCPASSSSSSSTFISNCSTSNLAAGKSSGAAPSQYTVSQLPSGAWSTKVKGKVTSSVSSSTVNANNACPKSSTNFTAKASLNNISSQHRDTISLNNNNIVKSVDSKSSATTSNSKEGDTSIADEDDNASDDCGMDVGSDRDSGCSSEYTNNSPTISADENGSTAIIGPTFPSSSLETQESSSVSVSGDADQDQDTVEPGLEGTSKPRGKRRYYMYGSHKLVKPIKEIPLRFQILLAETSAAKARCEGQPIYMQHQQPPQQMYDVVYYQLPDSGAQGQQQPQQQPQAQLNANANCFVPGQPGATQDGSQVVAPSYECYSLCYPAGNTVPPNMHGFPPNSVQPTPLFVPPIQQGPPPPNGAPQTGSVPVSSQNCQTIIVYSSQASQASVTPSLGSSASQQHIHPVNMPPPPFPPPTTLPPPPADPMSTNSTPCLSPSVNPIVMSIPSNPNQSKTNSSSIYSKPQVVLSVPPPSHPPPHNSNNVNKSSVSATQIPAPPPNSCMLSTNPTFLQPAPQHVALPSSSQHQQPINGVQTTSPSLPQHISPTAYPGGPASPYMYVYPSPPAGQQAAPPQVMYMVSPAYPTNAASYQQPVLVSSSCPVPVQ